MLWHTVQLVYNALLGKWQQIAAGEGFQSDL
jgi:hypothetical protein